MNSVHYAALLKEPSQRYAIKLSWVAFAAAFLFAVLVVAGIVARYSPVPIGDDWAGYVRFNLDVIDGKVSAWWALDDAHRLVLPRLLLWLDFHLFGARFIFVMVFNVLMRIGILIVFIACAREQIKNEILLVLSALFCVLTFSWTQSTGFYHAWVGLIAFSAILLPLLAFYWLHCTKRNSFWFLPAVLVGFASIGTMAYGLFVLPIMAVMSALIGLGTRRTIILAALSVASFIVYFSGFKYPPDAPPHPITFILFVLTYVGSPFYYVVYYWFAGLQHLAAFIFSHGSFFVTNNYLDYPASRVAGIGAAVVAGGILTAAMATIGWRWFRSERTDTSKAALLAFVGFVFAGAALAATGRGMYGFDYAVQERYAVGPLLAWQALAVFVFSRLDRERVDGVGCCDTDCALAGPAESGP